MPIHYMFVGAFMCVCVRACVKIEREKRTVRIWLTCFCLLKPCTFAFKYNSCWNLCLQVSLETFHMLCGVGGEKGNYFMCSVPCWWFSIWSIWTFESPKTVSKYYVGPLLLLLSSLSDSYIFWIYSWPIGCSC